MEEKSKLDGSEEDMQKQYDRIAEGYKQAQKDFYVKREDVSRVLLYNALDPFVLRGRVLDVGCGFGKDLAHFSSAGAQEVYGIDTSEKMIELAKKDYPFLENLSMQSFERMSFPDEFFEVISSRYVLHYAFDVESVFRELNRILKPGGVVGIVVAHPLSDFVAKGGDDYWKREIVKFSLFDRKVKITKYSHIFEDYFSPFVLENFDLLSLQEGSRDRASGKTENGWPTPQFLFFVLKKKSK